MTLFVGDDNEDVSHTGPMDLELNRIWNLTGFVSSLGLLAGFGS